MFFHKRCRIFAVLAFCDEFDCGGCCECDPVHAGAVEGIDEGRGIANEDEAITCVALRPIREISAEVHIALDEFRIAHHDARRWMS